MTTKESTLPNTNESSVDSRRSALRKIATGGALSAAPKIWVAPAVIAVTLPSHAKASGCCCTEPTAANVVLSNFTEIPGATPMVSAVVSITLPGTCGTGNEPAKITAVSTSNGVLANLNVPYTLPVVLGFGVLVEADVLFKKKPKDTVALTISWQCCSSAQVTTGSFAVNVTGQFPTSRVANDDTTPEDEAPTSQIDEQTEAEPTNTETGPTAAPAETSKTSPDAMS